MIHLAKRSIPPVSSGIVSRATGPAFSNFTFSIPFVKFRIRTFHVRPISTDDKDSR
ncbi:aerobic glycerol-3-phosphate dehydrogenase [Burkholderia cenocepacia]|nr:aerobic glycerol-3-phosphate dehydrogenase [Burkholderia cenocepacia]